MKEKDKQKDGPYFYDEEGLNEVNAQIVDAYNSGVIDQPNGNFQMSKMDESEDEIE